MSVERELQKLITEFGASIGMPSLALDDEGHCALRFDDTIVIDFQHDPNEDVLVLFSNLGVIPQEQIAVLSVAMLRGNHFWKSTRGATLSLVDDEDGGGAQCAYLAMQCVTSRLSVPKLSDLVETFVSTVEAWMELISDSSEPEVAEDRFDDFAMTPSASPYLRV